MFHVFLLPIITDYVSCVFIATQKSVIVVQSNRHTTPFSLIAHDHTLYASIP
jgi:hypothetical protein